ncbi:MAG: DUF2628 domain-containing protein [Parvibaculum sp.]
MRTYTVHELAGAPADGKGIVLVREGFSWSAVFFNLFWLLYKRLWIAAVLYFALALLVVTIARSIGVSEEAISVFSLVLQGFLGVAAHDIERWTLTRNGYREIGVATGVDLQDAERDFFRYWKGRVLASQPAPVKSFGAPVWPHREEPDAHGAIGLFPRAGG